jgi:hypothetical protein
MAMLNAAQARVPPRLADHDLREPGRARLEQVGGLVLTANPHVGGIARATTARFGAQYA